MIKFLIVAYRKNLSRTIPVVFLLITITIVFGGCAENYGRLQRSEEVDELFKGYQVLPDHNYYYVGPEGRPDAIMGIQYEYTLETTQWTQFKASDDILKKWVDTINFYHNTGVQYYPYGFFILDPAGSRLGIWYSIWDWTTVMMKDDKRIQVFPPAKNDFFEDGDELDKMDND
jgi:hypothetical protein